MAFDASVTLALLSIFIAASTIVDAFSIKLFWLKVSSAILGALISFVPLCIKIHVFWNSKQSRRKLIMKSIQQFIFSDYYDRVNQILWMKGNSNYCNITCENQTFYRNDYNVITNLDLNTSGKGLMSDSNGPMATEIDFGFRSRDSWNRTKPEVAKRVSDYVVEEVYFVPRNISEKRVRGRVVVKQHKGMKVGDFYIDGPLGKDDNTGGAFERSYHNYIQFNKNYTGTVLGDYRVECRFDPEACSLQFIYKCDSYPEGYAEKMKGVFLPQDFIIMIKLMKFMEPTGWIIYDKGPMIKKDSFIWHCWRIKDCFWKMKQEGYKLFEINYNTHGFPSFVEGEYSSSDFIPVVVEKCLVDASLQSSYNDRIYPVLESYTGSIPGISDEQRFQLIDKSCAKAKPAAFKGILNNWQTKKYLSDTNILRQMYRSPVVLGCQKLNPSRHLLNFLSAVKDLPENNEWIDPFEISKMGQIFNNLSAVKAKGSTKGKEEEGKKRKKSKCVLYMKQGMRDIIDKIYENKDYKQEINNLVSAKAMAISNSNLMNEIIEGVEETASFSQMDQLIVSYAEKVISKGPSRKKNVTKMKEGKGMNEAAKSSFISKFKDENLLSKDHILSKTMENIPQSFVYSSYKSVSFVFGGKVLREVLKSNEYRELLLKAVEKSSGDRVHYKKLSQCLRSSQEPKYVVNEIEADEEKVVLLNAFSCIYKVLESGGRKSDEFVKYEKRCKLDIKSKLIKMEQKNRFQPLRKIGEYSLCKSFRIVGADRIETNGTVGSISDKIKESVSGKIINMRKASRKKKIKKELLYPGGEVERVKACKKYENSSLRMKIVRMSVLKLAERRRLERVELPNSESKVVLKDYEEEMIQKAEVKVKQTSSVGSGQEIKNPIKKEEIKNPIKKEEEEKFKEAQNVEDNVSKYEKFKSLVDKPGHLKDKWRIKNFVSMKGREPTVCFGKDSEGSVDPIANMGTEYCKMRIDTKEFVKRIEGSYSFSKKFFSSLMKEYSLNEKDYTDWVKQRINQDYDMMKKQLEGPADKE